MSKEQKLQEALDAIRNSKGKIFSVIFIKRTDKSLRKMVCRTGVKKHLKGGKSPYNFSDKDLISVFDVQKKDYRTIDINSLVEVKINKEVYTF
jgi:hypothetical protein